jgi:hypothetical protein
MPGDIPDWSAVSLLDIPILGSGVIAAGQAGVDFLQIGIKVPRSLQAVRVVLIAPAIVNTLGTIVRGEQSNALYISSPSMVNSQQQVSVGLMYGIDDSVQLQVTSVTNPGAAISWWLLGFYNDAGFRAWNLAAAGGAVPGDFVTANLQDGAGVRWLIGQQLMAASMPVVIASNQSNLPENLAQVGGAAISEGVKLASASIPVAEAYYDGQGDSAPAAGTRATVTLAANATRPWICRTWGGSLVATAAGAQFTLLRLRDGATGAGTILRSSAGGVQAAIGAAFGVQLAPLAYKGTINVAMTAEWDAGAAGLMETANVGAVLG